MKVNNLQQFVRSLVAPMQQAGAAAKVTDDIEKAVTDLEPFAQLDVWQLSELLRQAKEYRDTGTLPAPAGKRPTARKPAAPKHDPAVVADFAQKVRALEEKAATTESTREELRAGLDALKLDKLTKDNLVGIARELGRQTTAKTTKGQAADIIRRVVLERKEILESAIS
jgi:uncharacterized protein HemY